MTQLLEHEHIAATEEERSILHDIEEMLRQYRERQSMPKLVGPDGEEIVIPKTLFHLLKQVVRDLAQGQVVAIASLHRELTTQQAADLLNVSRPYLVQLLENGRLPFTKTGTHRRIRFNDLMQYKAKRDATRKRGLAQLTQMSQELGLYDD